MAGLLALAPFLHSHFGASHESGFHLDGMHAVHATASAGMSAMQAGEEESPALGVAASLPQAEDEALSLLGLVLLSLAGVLPACSPLPVPRPDNRQRPHTTLYRAGLPPPCLAPPVA